MANDSNAVICLCSLDGIIDIISKKWALLIINEIGNHKRIRYNNLMKEYLLQVKLQSFKNNIIGHMVSSVYNIHD